MGGPTLAPACLSVWGNIPWARCCPPEAGLWHLGDWWSWSLSWAAEGADLGGELWNSAFDGDCREPCRVAGIEADFSHMGGVGRQLSSALSALLLGLCHPRARAPQAATRA